MRYLSLFSGIEAATVAWHPLGWECAAVAEVEPFPCKVLAHHYPNVPNLGDVTKITKEQIEALGHIDVIVFGSPCQDLSVAGHRKGLLNADGTVTRSGLFFTAINIARWSGARFWLWENVPGAYSSSKGRDFASVVEFMAGLDSVEVPPRGWATEGVAVGDNGLLEWGTLDAQWFGVAQRRRRVFALLDTGDWTSRPPILLEPEGLRGDSAPSREAGEEVTGRAAFGFNANARPDEMRISELNDGLTCSQNAATVYPINTLALGGRPDPVNDARMMLGIGDDGDPQFTLKAAHCHAVATSMQVRRLTPTECSRLQGFPDDYLETQYADADEANAAQILHALWREAGTPFVEKQEWRTGISAALLTPEILLAGVYGGWISWSLSARCAAARGAIQGREL